MHLDIENIAGIRSGEAELHPGLNVVTAENWQGKSSFMTAIQVVMGSTGRNGDPHPLTDGATEGEVRLRTDGGTYETKLVRREDAIHRRGDVYLTDEQDRLCARLFAFLGENNPVREAVRSGDDLASLLTRPLDVENIDGQIAQLKRERRSVESELERAGDAADRITAVQSTVTQLEEEIDELRAERDELVSDADASGERTEEELSSKRAMKEQLTNQIGTLENKIDRQETRLQERKAELADLTIPDEPELTAGIEENRSRITEIETNISLLEDLYRANRRILDEGKVRLVADVERTVTGDEIECWICGEETSKPAVSERLGAINEKITALRNEKETLENEVEEIQNRRDEIRRQRRRKEDLETEVSELTASLDENRSRLTDLKDRLERVTEELETLRESTQETNSRLTDLESEIKYKQNELEDRREKLEDLERDARRRDRLEDERDALTEEIEQLRARRNRKKRELAERFGETMEDIVGALEPGFESARLTPKTDAEGHITDFDLVVAREGRETRLDALSEGEVELLGIVTALAGYETFDVGDRVPVILLDGLTALSAANYRAVVRYLSDKSDSLVTTAYPETGDFDGHVVSPRRWDIVSGEKTTVS